PSVKRVRTMKKAWSWRGSGSLEVRPRSLEARLPPSRPEDASTFANASADRRSFSGGRSPSLAEAFGPGGKPDTTSIASSPSRTCPGTSRPDDERSARARRHHRSPSSRAAGRPPTQDLQSASGGVGSAFDNNERDGASAEYLRQEEEQQPVNRFAGRISGNTD